MFYKNLIVYTIDLGFGINAETLDSELKKHPATDCAPMQERTFGWVSPFSDSDLFGETLGTCIFICAQVQTKTVKSAELNEQLHKKIDEIEANEGRRPVKKEREQIKEDIRAAMLHNTYPVTKRIGAYIDYRSRLLVVNTASAKVADDFTARLREAIGALPILPLGKSEKLNITKWWLQPESRPVDLTFESDLSLSLAQDGTVKATYKNLDLEAPEIKDSLEAGMLINKARVDMGERLTVTVTDDWQFKRIKYADSLIELSNETDSDRTDAMIMLGAIREMLYRVIESQLIKHAE